MENLGKEIYKILDEINDKLKNGQKATPEDFQVLFLSAILEEGANEPS
jgi:hypothetical protein